MLFFEYFRKYVNKKITLYLKNELVITGILKSVDPYLNMQIISPEVSPDCPGLGKISKCSVRGSSIKTVDLEKDIELEARVTDATYLRFGLDR